MLVFVALVLGGTLGGCAPAKETKDDLSAAPVNAISLRRGHDQVQSTDPQVSVNPVAQKPTPYLASWSGPTPYAVDKANYGSFALENDCVVAYIDGLPGPNTAIFLSGTRLTSADGAKHFITLPDGHRLVLGRKYYFSGNGGADSRQVSEDELYEPIPERCPKALFGVGGINRAGP